MLLLTTESTFGRYDFIVLRYLCKFFEIQTFAGRVKTFTPGIVEKTASGLTMTVALPFFESSTNTLQEFFITF